MHKVDEAYLASIDASLDELCERSKEILNRFDQIALSLASLKETSIRIGAASFDAAVADTSNWVRR